MSNWNNNGIINAGQVPAIASGNLADIPAYNIPNMLFVSMDTQALYANDGAGFVLIGGPGTGTITGSGTINYIPVFTAPGIIGDGFLKQVGTGKVSLDGSNNLSEYSFQVGDGRTNDGYAYMDLIGDPVYTDYGLRLQRGNTGQNTPSAIIHRGTGLFSIETNEDAAIQFGNSSFPSFQLSSYLSGGNAIVRGSLTANSLIKDGGTSVQYLMADGSTSTLINPVTGTGVGGRLTVWDGLSTITSYPDLIWSDTQKHLGINKVAPVYALDVIGQSGTVAGFRNTTAINTQILVGNSLADLQLRVLSTGDSLIFSDTGKYLAFGTNGASERMRIVSGAARVLIGGIVDNTIDTLQVFGSIYSTGLNTIFVDGEALRLQSATVGASKVLTYYTSAGIRRGYIGYLNASNDAFTINNETGGVLYLNGGTIEVFAPSTTIFKTGQLTTAVGTAINSGATSYSVAASSTRGVINIGGSTDQFLTLSSNGYLFGSSSLIRILGNTGREFDIVADGAQVFKIFNTTRNVKIQNGGTFTDDGVSRLQVTGQGVFTDRLTATRLYTSNQGTSFSVATFQSTGGDVHVGRNNSTGTSFGGSAYAAILYSAGTSYPIELMTGGSIRFAVSGLGIVSAYSRFIVNNTTVDDGVNVGQFNGTVISLGYKNATGNNSLNSTSGSTSIGTGTNTYKLNVAGGIYDSDTQSTLNQSKFGVFGGMTFTATGTESATYINAGIAGGYVMASAGTFTPVATAKQGAIVGSYYATAASTVAGIQNAIYANCELSSSAIITTLAAYRVGKPEQFSGGSAFTGTITNMVGLYIDDISASSLAGSFTNKYGIYQEGTSDKNFFGGEIILGAGQVVSASVLNAVTNKVKFIVGGTTYYFLASTSAT